MLTVCFRDPRYGANLDQGFTIFRDHKCKHYTATAVQCFWLSTNDGQMYGTLNELNKSIGVEGAEIAWKAAALHGGQRLAAQTAFGPSGPEHIVRGSA